MGNPPPRRPSYPSAQNNRSQLRDSAGLGTQPSAVWRSPRRHMTRRQWVSRRLDLDRGRSGSDACRSGRSGRPRCEGVPKPREGCEGWRWCPRASARRSEGGRSQNCVFSIYGLTTTLGGVIAIAHGGGRGGGGHRRGRIGRHALLNAFRHQAHLSSGSTLRRRLVLPCFDAP